MIQKSWAEDSSKGHRPTIFRSSNIIGASIPVGFVNDEFQIVVKFAQFDPSNAENRIINGSDDDGRVACNYCDRKFGVSRICEHEQICANLKNRQKLGRKGGQSAGGTYRKRKTLQEQTFQCRADPQKEPRAVEEEVDESVEIAQAAAELQKALRGMSEMEALEYQLSKMKRLQRMKH